MNKKCQVFTPTHIVIQMLDSVGYISGLYGKKIIENACGDGNILVEIVKRYIEDCLLKKYTLREIKKGLQTDIFGVEIDTLHYINCVNNLNNTAEKYGLSNISWNIYNEDILKLNLDLKFDFVVGNPPYISYRDLDEETRIYVRDTFKTCYKGKFDYCYAFIEVSLNSLNETGKMAYLIPSSIFKNVFAKELRKMMLANLTEIHDFTIKKIFKNALVATSIIIFDKPNSNNKIKYHNIGKNKSFVLYKEALLDKWIFSKSKEFKDTNKKYRFGDYFNASISIATLLNEAYVLNDFEIHDEYILVEEFKLERKVIRETSSPRQLNSNKKELIIFPYYFKDNALKRYSFEEFHSNFPETVEYLKLFKEKLLNRKFDSNTLWFEYGRSQALSHSNQKKLLTSTVVTKKIKVYELSKYNIPYSGIYIVSKGDWELGRAKKILESKEFYEYVKEIGINASGTSLRITSRDINDFEFSIQGVL